MDDFDVYEDELNEHECRELDRDRDAGEFSDDEDEDGDDAGVDDPEQAEDAYLDSYWEDQCEVGFEGGDF